MTTERLGVFGGTFDPVHVGHLVAAVNVRHELTLDRVLFVVANKPWQKGERVVAGADDRAAMVEAAVEDVAGLEVSRLELDRGGPSYTVDTLEPLAERGAELFLIVGADAAASIETWHRVDAVRRLATLVVVTRAGWEMPDLAPGWRLNLTYFQTLLGPEQWPLNRIGVTPDVVVAPTPDDEAAGWDPQLAAALEVLRTQRAAP